MSAADRISIEFEFSRSDYVAWVAALQRTPEVNRAWQKCRSTIHAMRIGAVLGSALWIWCLYAKWHAFPRVRPEDAVLLLAVGAGLVGLWWSLIRRLRQASAPVAWARLEQSADSEIARLWQGRKRVTVSPGFLEWDAPHCVFLVRWTSVGRVARSGELLELEIGAAEQLFPIPVRVFADGQERAFVELASRYRDAAGGRVIGVVDLLKDRDFACPECRYNLRGAEKAMCPECGREIGVGEVMAE